MELKKCNKCGEDKPKEKGYHLQVRPNGEHFRRGICKDCRNSDSRNTIWRKKTYHNGGKETQAKWQRKQILENTEYRLAKNMRAHCARAVRYAMNGEDLNSSSENLGCTYGELKKHMESQFKDGMTWENYGREGWHIDHIMPLSKGGSNHYTNLQPLWAADNISKGAKWGQSRRIS